MKKKLLSVLCAAALAVSSLSGCSQSAKKEQATPVPTKAVADHNEEKESNLGLWTRAAGSVLIYINDGNPYYFGGYETTDDNKNAAINILKQSWGIKDRVDLLKQIKTLLTTGDRKGYRKEAKEMNRMSKKDLKTAMKQLSGSLLAHYQMVQYNWKTWREKGLVAWDMCRVSHLVQWGYVAGYLEREEAQALMEPSAMRLKEHFSSWEEVQNNWLDGFCLHANIDREAKNTDYTNRKAIYETICSEQKKDDLLYDDTLFSSDIIPVSKVSYRTLLKEIKQDKKK